MANGKWTIETNVMTSRTYLQHEGKNAFEVLLVGYDDVAKKLNAHNYLTREVKQLEAHRNKLADRLVALDTALRAILFQVVQGPVLERDACIGGARAAIADVPRMFDALLQIANYDPTKWDAATLANIARKAIAGIE